MSKSIKREEKHSRERGQQQGKHEDVVTAVAFLAGNFR